jgi:hypothetical protein
MAKEKKKQTAKGHLISICFYTVLGVILGLAMISFVEWQLPERIGSSEKAYRICVMLVFLYLSFFIHIVLHETGHLIFGLMSGYQFSSFRIGTHMLMKENGKLVHRKIKIAGTGGQCLMIPPEMVDGKFPVVLYNLGGSIVNLVVAALMIPVFVAIDKSSVFALFVFLFIAMGAITGLSNGIPMRTKTVDNDGYNAISLGKSREAMRAFWIQMKTNEQLTKGIRTKDMPEEWFEVPSDDAMKNPMVATIGVYAASRMMDQHRFEEAGKLIDYMLKIETGMVAIHRNLLICDQIYLELIGQNRSDRVEALYTKELKKFIKAMKTFPSVIRLEYAYRLLAEHDPESAAKSMAAFEKVAATYPYPNDINTERELMEIVDDKVNV